MDQHDVMSKWLDHSSTPTPDDVPSEEKNNTYPQTKESNHQQELNMFLLEYLRILLFELKVNDEALEELEAQMQLLAKRNNLRLWDVELIGQKLAKIRQNK